MPIRVYTFFYILATVILVFCSCAQDDEEFHIGVSQCAEGKWRDKVNSEMLAAQYLYEKSIRVDIVTANDDAQLQIHQIDSMAASGIDLLVVAPGESAPVAQAISRTMKKGLPVVVFDRKVDTDDYTAFIGGDNVEVGEIIGAYVARIAKNAGGRRTKVLEITGSLSTSPAKERHEGFSRVMSNQSNIDYQYEKGDWTIERTYDIVNKRLNSGEQPDIIFCHNDYMTRGACRAVKEKRLTSSVKVIGTDGLPGAGEGIENVKQGILAGTYIYPSNGEKIVRLALDILQNKPYRRHNTLNGMMVTPENVDMIALGSEEAMMLNKNLATMQNKLNHSLGLYNSQRKILVASLVSVLLLLIVVILVWMVVAKSRKLNRRMRRLNEEQTQFYTNASHQLRTPLTLIAGPLKELSDSHTLQGKQLEMVEVMEHNVRQLEKLISNVLNFRKSVTTVQDDDASAMAAGESVMRKSRLSVIKQEDTVDLPLILIIDDNDDMRTYLHTLLVDKFYVLEASDGQTGLKLANEHVPDLVLSDVMMPVMDGLQFCKHLKEDDVTSHIPVILLTARSAESQQIEGFECGADAYVTKPFSADLLIARIYSILKNRKLLSEFFNAKQDTEQKEETLPQVGSKEKQFVESLKEAVYKNMGNPSLKMDELGEELGLSRVQLYRKVKVLTGISPVELLRQMRLQRGYSLLTTTTKTVNEIAYEVGFNTPGYFSKCFKAQYGKYPMDLRS